MGSRIKLLVVFIQIISTFGLLLINSKIGSVSETQIAYAVPGITPNPKNIMTNFKTEEVKKAIPAAVAAIDEDIKEVPKKASYTIAAIGDSMIETMGDSLPYLGPLLRNKYPDTNFVFYNYGIGSENVSEAINRFDNKYSYKNKNYPPIAHINADIVIVGSYAYNPLYKEGENHWLKLAELIEEAKAVSKKVYVLAEIAPLKDDFSKGVGGVNWPPEIVGPHIVKIINGLNDAIGLSIELNTGLIDVFNKSKTEEGYGIPEFVSTHDGIHPSIEGHELTAQTIADTITLDP